MPWRRYRVNEVCTCRRQIGQGAQVISFANGCWAEKSSGSTRSGSAAQRLPAPPALGPDSLSFIVAIISDRQIERQTGRLARRTDWRPALLSAMEPEARLRRHKGGCGL